MSAATSAMRSRSSSPNGSAREMSRLAALVGIRAGVDVLDGGARRARQEDGQYARVLEMAEARAVGVGALGDDRGRDAEALRRDGAVDHAPAVERFRLAADDVLVDAHVTDEEDVHHDSFAEASGGVQSQ